MTDRGIPLKSLSDGSCLFSSASIAITGDNRFVTELRVRTCVEMVTNHEIYKALPNAPDLLDTSPSFDESSLDCAKPHGFSSQWTIYALSNVLQTHINVIYPPMNGKQDRPFKVFNATCSPRTDVEADRTIKIMWSNISPNFPERGSWTANHFPQFAKYFKNNTDNLKKFVWEPRKNKVVPEKWTNNACESMNNILKLSTNWKTCKLPELVEKLHKIVQLQYRDIRRALYGEGNYAMAPWTRKFQVSHVAWSTKSAEEKDALMKKFQRFTFRKEKEISSSDGNLKIPKTPTTARKPNQKKRIRSTKTTTIKFE